MWACHQRIKNQFHNLLNKVQLIWLHYKHFKQDFSFEGHIYFKGRDHHTLDFLAVVHVKEEIY